jgi:acyl-CoA dehydrogenase
MFRASVRKFMATEVAPHREDWERDGVVSRKVWEQAGAAGFLCTTVSEEYGGAGAGFRYAAVLLEEQARSEASGPGFSVHSDIVAPYIETYGSDELKQRFLPGLVSGDLISAVAMSEPDAGSDLQGIKTTAIRDGDEFVVNGSKTFVTNGQLCDIVVVVAKTDPSEGAKGITLFVVEAARDGFERGRNLKKVGLKAQDTSELFLADVRIPASNMIGDEGVGFAYLMQQLPRERLIIAISSVAVAVVALQWTVDYVKQRTAFGRPIATFQNTRFKLAEMATDIQVERVFIDRCISLLDEGKLDVQTAAMAKLHSTDLLCRVVDECVQLHGGYGYMWEYPICRAWANSRVTRIYGGTNEIMKELISRALLA